MSAAAICCTAGCGRPATQRCPKCIELQLPDAHFCSQECFRESFAAHKPLHQGRYDFVRAFDRGEKHYTREWWGSQRAGFVHYWNHLCALAVDSELVERCVGVCQHLCDAPEMSHLAKEDRKRLQKSLAAFKVIYDRMKGAERRVEYVCALLDSFCVVEFLANEASEEAKLAWLGAQWRQHGARCDAGRCMVAIAPLLMLKVEGDATVEGSLAAFCVEDERLRYLSEFTLPVFEVLSRCDYSFLLFFHSSVIAVSLLISTTLLLCSGNCFATMPTRDH
jgi:hypothetical protein